MTHMEAGLLAEALYPPLPPPRDRLPTPPFELDEYARLSSLPDADDELVFTAGPLLFEITARVPHVVRSTEESARLEPNEELVLSLVDGLSPVSLLVRLAADPDAALVVLCDLHARGLVTFD